MSVRVNLLPEEVNKRARAARARGYAALGGVAAMALLGTVYMWESGRVDAVQRELDDEQAVLAALEADVASLGEFAELDQRAQQSNQVLVTALADDVSFAGLLQDLAAITPSDVSYETLTIGLSEPTATLGDVRPAYGTLTLSGATLDHAPGVERLLISLDQIAAFSDVFFQTGTDDSTNDVTFTVTADLGPEMFTGRYLNGVPEVLR